MNELDTIIIGINTDVTSVKVMSGEVLLIAKVKEKLREGQKFSTVDLESGQVADVLESSDGTLKMKLVDGTEKSLEKIPIFT